MRMHMCMGMCQDAVQNADSVLALDADAENHSITIRDTSVNDDMSNGTDNKTDVAAESLEPG